MSDTKNTTMQLLRQLNLSPDEARLYLELLRGPATHLELSRSTAINRTKVYRLAEQLEKRSLITARTDDRGTFLTAADPATLEVAIVTEEERIKNQRAIFNHVLPSLRQIKNAKDSPLNFSIQTYEGVDGFKQMLWHELKATDEILIFGHGEIESLVESTRWAEKHRVNTVAAGYKIREIINPDGKKADFTKNQDFMLTFQKRIIDPGIILFEEQTAIYNDTVATYHWTNGQKVGFEVTNRAYTTTMRQIFEQLWQIAKV